jgi:hypothetical protein
MAELGKEDGDEMPDDNKVVIVEDEAPQEEKADEIKITETAPEEPKEVETASEQPDERESIRERRRKEKQERKQRRDTAIKRDKVELNFLRKRNEDLERRVSAQEQKSQSIEMGNLDQHLAVAQKELNLADQVIAKGVETQSGEDVQKALAYRDQAQKKIAQLERQKQQANVQMQQQQQPQTPVDDRVLAHAQEFMDDNPWYDINGGNEESSIVNAIDASLTKEGFDPATDEYWDELTERAARRLPEKFEDFVEEVGEQEEPTPVKKKRVARGGPAVGSGKEHAPASTRKEVYISPERKQAMMDHGVWDDPVLRQKYVKRYMEWDRENKA